MMPAALLALAFALAPQNGAAGAASDPGTSAPAAGQPEVVDRIVAIVNDQVLTQRMVAIRADAAAADAANTGRTREQLYRDVFQSMLLDLLFQEGFKLSGPVEYLDRIVQDEVDREIEEAGSVAALSEQLRLNHMTLEERTERLRREFMAILFQYEETGRRPSGGKNGFKLEKDYVSPAEIEDYYNKNINLFTKEHRVQARMIKLQDAPDQPAAADRIRDIARRIQAGEISFLDAAAQYTQFRPTEKGNMGLRNPEVPYFETPIQDFLKSAQEGQMSDPLALSSGWALVLVEKVQAGGTQPLDDPEVQLRIVSVLVRGQHTEIFRSAIRRLRERCYVWGDQADQALDALLREEQSPGLD